jgi:DNA mismatch endonuclease Vsr
MKDKIPDPRRRRPKDVVSYNMSRIRNKNTELENRMEQILIGASLSYEKHLNVEGKPDFAFPREKVAVFCDSHFWHGYRWNERARAEIRVNRGFWLPKIEKNIRRDREVNRVLKREGWTVLRLWEHEIKENPERCLERIMKALERGRNRCR